MNRLSFLKRLLAALIGAASVSSLRGPQAHAQPNETSPSDAAEGAEDQKTPADSAQHSASLRYLLSATVAGKHYHEFRNRGPKLLGEDEDIYTSIHSEFTEHPAQLVPEPDNPFDFRAIAVYFQGHKMGYLPRKDNKIIYNLLRDGAQLETKLRLHIEGEIEPDILYTYDFEFMYEMRVRVYLKENGAIAEMG